jgi:hypothetical protein
LIIFSTFLPCRQAADDLPHRFRRETIQARQSGSIIQLQPSGIVRRHGGGRMIRRLPLNAETVS